MIGKDGWLIEGHEHDCGNCGETFMVDHFDMILCLKCLSKDDDVYAEAHWQEKNPEYKGKDKYGNLVEGKTWIKAYLRKTPPQNKQKIGSARNERRIRRERLNNETKSTRITFLAKNIEIFTQELKELESE